MKEFNQNKAIYYAGYGLFIDEEFGRMLFGQDVQSNVVEKDGYELVVLSWNELPSEIQSETPSSYRIYAVRQKEGATLTLRVWELTRQQKELADQWNWGDELYLRETTFLSYEDPRTVEIDVINSRDIGNIVDGKNYEPYLNDKETVLGFAREAYEASLLSKEGKFSRERMY